MKQKKFWVIKICNTISWKQKDKERPAILEILDNCPGLQTEFASHNLNIITNELIKTDPFTFALLIGILINYLLPKLLLLS